MQADSPSDRARLKVLMVSALLHPRFGGPPAALATQLQALKGRADVTLYGLQYGDDAAEIAARFPDARLFPATWPRRWFRGAGLAAALRAAAPAADLLHAHMLWDHTVWAAWRAAAAAGKPLIITPHGSLAQAWRLRSPHKRLYRRLLLDRMLADPAVSLQVLTEAEAEACRAAGCRCRIALVPNGVDPQSLLSGADPADVPRLWPRLAGRRLLLYVGRLWRGKGLEVLLEAWAGQPAEGWHLVLAGPDYRGYRRRLERRIVALGLADRVLLTGPVDAGRRASLLSAASGFVLPSFGEGVPMALLEAAAAGLPTIFTDACNMHALAERGGGWQVPVRSVAALRSALAALLTAPQEELARRAAAARRFVSREHSLSRVGDGLLLTYREALESR